ncbi:MAG TPA: MBL fold metallo-hydrolase [Streptosporangiaceae bacterium]|nr:MBL fold metallo-hydrolase [Streptosporangiaceae bacterium]
MNRVREISAGVLVATAELYVTNSTVVADGSGGCLVIDPAVTVGEVAGLAADLRSLSLDPVAGFSTHPHWDHVLWSAELGDVPRFAAPLAAATAERERTRLIEGVQSSAPGHDMELFCRLMPLGQPDTIPWDGPAAVVITHQGHAPGHSAVFLPDSGTLIAGDMCSDIEVPLLDLDQADPVGDYLAALDRFAALPVERVIPGHGRVGDHADFRRRIELDRAYLENLRRGPELTDPRPLAGWLIDEHKAQAARLANARSR